MKRPVAAGRRRRGGGDSGPGGPRHNNKAARPSQSRFRQVVPDGLSWVAVIELIELPDGALLLDLRRWRRLAHGRMIPTARGLAIRLEHAPALLDAIVAALAGTGATEL